MIRSPWLLAGWGRKRGTPLSWRGDNGGMQARARGCRAAVPGGLPLARARGTRPWRGGAFYFAYPRAAWRSRVCGGERQRLCIKASQNAPSQLRADSLSAASRVSASACSSLLANSRMHDPHLNVMCLSGRRPADGAELGDVQPRPEQAGSRDPRRGILPCRDQVPRRI